MEIENMSKNKLNMFISDDKRLDLLIRSLHLNINREEYDKLINELYRHIEHTNYYLLKMVTNRENLTKK